MGSKKEIRAIREAINATEGENPTDTDLEDLSDIEIIQLYKSLRGHILNNRPDRVIKETVGFV